MGGAATMARLTLGETVFRYEIESQHEFWKQGLVRVYETPQDERWLAFKDWASTTDKEASVLEAVVRARVRVQNPSYRGSL